MQKRLEAIYREHRQGLFSLAMSITRRRESAEDAVHDAFVRLWRTAAAPQGDLVAYVYASVRNAAVDRKRRRGERPELVETMFAGGLPDPSDCAAEHEQAGRLRRAVEALPDDQREAVVLRAFAGLTFQQMAETLGEPLPTVASRYRRALERIRQRLGDAD